MMHHMKRASVRDLRYNFLAVERMLRKGETIEITQRKRVIGKLTPAAPEAKGGFQISWQGCGASTARDSSNRAAPS